MLLHRLHDGLGLLGDVPVATPMCLPDWRFDMPITRRCLFFLFIRIRSIYALTWGRAAAKCWTLMVQEVGGRLEKNKVKVK